MTVLAEVVVVGAGLWLVGLALFIVVRPAIAERFLMKFASSARAHYLEQALRLLAGSAIVIAAERMKFPGAFAIFGWVLVATALGLLIVPWKWHNRFGSWAIPFAIRNIKLYALGAFSLGCLILYAVLS